jgi:hypothetical protein
MIPRPVGWRRSAAGNPAELKGSDTGFRQMGHDFHLQTCWLNNNKLTGSVPKSMSSDHSMQDFRIYENAEVSPPPSQWSGPRAAPHREPCEQATLQACLRCCANEMASVGASRCAGQCLPPSWGTRTARTTGRISTTTCWTGPRSASSARGTAMVRGGERREGTQQLGA